MTSMITARVDSEKRKKAEKVFSEVGLTTSGAVNLFICAVAMSGGIPFPVGIPSGEYPRMLREQKPAQQSRNSGFKLGLANGRYTLANGFDATFDAMDADVANLFSGSEL